MRFSSYRITGPVVAIAVFAMLLSAAGPANGAQKVPIGFDDYHGYTSMVKYVKSIAGAYPDITKLLEIGKSTMGRPLYVLVISNQKNGEVIDTFVKLRNKRREGVKNVPPMSSYQGKPGHWICGSTHGNEYTGTEVCLYIIDKLVSGYGSIPGITKIVDGQTFYICPVVNPDGHFNSLEKGISQRRNSMKKDDDGDGKINEDTYDDINKDGHITQFRYPDPKGRFVIDEVDPRLMVRLDKEEKTEKQRYSVIREDIDNDGDGKRGEDRENGIDMNRNFPEGWFTKDGFAGGKGDYPTSAPEIHAIAEFFTNHTNILMAQNYHTSGGFTYRPMGTAPHSGLHPKDVSIFDRIMGKKYLEIIGEEIPAAWLETGSLKKYQEKLKEKKKNKYAIARGYELPRGWRVRYDEEQDKRYSYGMATDWMYKQYGAYALTTELWNPMKDIKDFPELSDPDSRIERERTLLKYQDEKYEGKLFIPWEKFKHPELGEGDVGGWIPKYRGNALPGEPLLYVCENHWQFELFRAGLQPEIVISEAKAKVLYTTNSAKAATVSGKDGRVTIKKGGSKGKYKIVEVTAKIENKGKLATHIARGAQLSGNREDVVWLVGEQGKVTFLQGTAFQKLGVIEGTQKIPVFSGRGAPAPSAQQQRMRRMRFFRPPGFPMQRFRGRRFEPKQVKQKGPKRDVKWLVAVEGDTPLTVVVTSQKGGTKSKRLKLQ